MVVIEASVDSATERNVDPAVTFPKRGSGLPATAPAAQIDLVQIARAVQPDHTARYDTTITA